ncbi:endo-1,4-beta-xylanase [Lewinella sp. JB7]|uniref:endo-1,4-beta-xylanase n=1 Tax=Lewinella sp. JB7 TaxID=2962887 RepID=UPI0020C9A240|nr:endo-1,4-beta-xylanase [Lewinella sp. JB7]MCP9236925.1 endo-1,4-beta-xylanase [Lewinella sp. JB7]
MIDQVLSLLVLLSLLVACAEAPPPPAESPPAGLAALYATDFLVGAALGGRVIRDEDSLSRALVVREYSTITPENVMKWEKIQPTADTYNWGPADDYVAFGEEHDLFIVGHTLVWHSQLSDYVKQITDPGAMRTALRQHIGAVAGRYAGRIDGWDVVNEALNDDGTYRESEFYRVLGEEYLTLAFRYAAEAAPDAQLYYNDYNMWNGEKRDGAIRMIEKIRADGGRVDGIGMQGHYGISGPTIDTIEAAIEAYAAAGLPVMFTELDVTVLPNPWDLEGAEVSQNFENAPDMNPYPESLPDSVQTALAIRYADLFRLFHRHRDKIERVTFWGTTDASSWLNGWPIRGRTNYPLLFDRKYRPKPAYDSVAAVAATPR